MSLLCSISAKFFVFNPDDRCVSHDKYAGWLDAKPTSQKRLNINTISY